MYFTHLTIDLQLYYKYIQHLFFLEFYILIADKDRLLLKLLLSCPILQYSAIIYFFKPF